MKKIVFICTALVVALGMLGIGYAMWFDPVKIEGKVKTGSVDMVVEEVSSTYIYKVLHDFCYNGKTYKADDVFVSSKEMSPLDIDPSKLLFVSSAVTTYKDDTVSMDFCNIFPIIDLCPIWHPDVTTITADVLFKYAGTIPARILYAESVDPSIQPYLVQKWYKKEVGGNWRSISEGSLDDWQVHQNDELKLLVYLDPIKLQLCGEDAQGLSGKFCKTLFVYQWNELGITVDSFK